MAVGVNFYDVLFTCQEKYISCPLIHTNNIDRQVKPGKPATQDIATSFLLCCRYNFFSSTPLLSNHHTTCIFVFLAERLPRVTKIFVPDSVIAQKIRSHYSFCKQVCIKSSGPPPTKSNRQFNFSETSSIVISSKN